MAMNELLAQLQGNNVIHYWVGGDKDECPFTCLPIERGRGMTSAVARAYIHI